MYTHFGIWDYKFVFYRVQTKLSTPNYPNYSKFWITKFKSRKVLHRRFPGTPNVINLFDGFYLGAARSIFQSGYQLS